MPLGASPSFLVHQNVGFSTEGYPARSVLPELLVALRFGAT